MDFGFDGSSMDANLLWEYSNAFMHRSIQDNLTDFITVAGGLMTMRKIFKDNEAMVMSIDHLLDIMKNGALK